MKNNIILLALIGALVTACGSGSSNSSTTPQTPAQQFATNITSKSAQVANSAQSISTAAFLTNTPSAYLLTASNSDASKQYLYYFNDVNWQQYQLTFESSTFITLAMTYSNNIIYLGGYSNVSGMERAQLYSYQNGTTKLVESNPYLTNCNNYCYINALTASSDGSSIYVSGVDDSGIEIYEYNNGKWIELPSAPRSSESAIIKGQTTFLLGVNALTVDVNNNLYLGAAFGAYKGPYEGYLAKFTNGSWVQESLPQQFSWSVNGLTYTNNQVYASGINPISSGADYSILSFYNTQWNQLYGYTISESSQYYSPAGIYSDTYGNIYSLINQNGARQVLVLSVPAQ